MLPYNPAIPLLGIHIKETRIERDTCTPVFITALFLIARTWKQLRWPSADEWIRKLWYKYTMEYYSAIKKNTFESVLMRWMELEPIIQSDISQKEKFQYSILMYIYMQFRKMVTITLYVREQKRHKCVEQSWTLWEREGGMILENGIETYKISYKKRIASPGSMQDAGYMKLGAGALGWPRGTVWGRRWEGDSGWGTRVHPCWIHVDVWQNQYNIVK